MSPTIITNTVYVIVFVGCLVLEHFGIIPNSSEYVVLSALAGHAIGSGTLVASKQINATSPDVAPNTTIPTTKLRTPTNG